MMKKKTWRVRKSALLVSGAFATVSGIAAGEDAQSKVALMSGIEEVVVTATRRPELLKDVPIAVSAISGAEVEAKRLSNFVDIVNITPGPTFVPVKGSTASSVQIRGQYSANDATALENPIGVYIDDIYYGSLASFDMDFFDVQQIAILRGPQGTTFGRNAVGGALQITSNVAKVGEKSGQISITALKFKGAESGIESQGYVNFPLSNDVAGRVAYSVKNDGGYQHNLVTGNYLADNKIFSIKGSVTYQPSADFKVTGLVSWSHRDNKGDGARIYGMGTIAANEARASSSFHDVMQDDEGKIKRDIGSAMLRIETDTAWGAFTSITGYRDLEASFAEDSDGGPLALNFPSVNYNTERQISQEFRLVSPKSDTFEYLVGVYMGREDLMHSILFNFDGTIPGSRLATFTGGTKQRQLVRGDVRTNSFGPYAEGKWHLNDKWALTGGLRWVYEDKTGRTQHVGTSAFYGGPYDVSLPGTVDKTHTWKAWTPRAILEYKPSKDVMFYGSASRGFQGGGWVLTATSAAKAGLPLKEETTVSYEVGTKSLWFDGMLSTNLAVYTATTTNLQVRSLVGGVLTDSNAGKEKVNGWELETVLRPTPDLALGLNYAYTDAKYEEFNGCAAGNVSCTGLQVPFTPKHDMTVFADYRWRMASGGSISFHIDDKFADEYQLVSTNLQQIAVPLTKRSNIINASATWEPDNANWNLRFWGKNLADKTVVTNGLNYFFYNMTIPEAVAAGAKADSERLTVGAPRTLGMTLTYKFD